MAINRLSVLIVEDHADSAVVLQKLLQPHVNRIAVASCCASAMKLAADSEFDIVLCDLALPDGDGITLLARLRSLYPIKAIALSGNGNLDEYASAGFQGRIVKPMKFDDLLHAIEAAMSNPAAPLHIDNCIVANESIA